jgi:hypothetical protein
VSLRKSSAFIGGALAVVGTIAGIVAWWVPSSSPWLDHHGFAAWPLAALLLILFVWAASSWYQSTQELNDKLAEQELKAKSIKQELEARLAKYALVPADKQLFDAFKTTLPKDSPVVSWLRYEADARSYRGSVVKPLEDFVGTWRSADYHFVNSELEQASSQLVAAGADFLAYQAENSWPASRSSQIHDDDLVYRYYDPDDIVDNRRIRELNIGLNERANKVLDAHNKLYMVGSRLGL